MKNGGCVERTRVIQLHYSQIIGSFEDNIVEQPHILSYRDPLPPSLPPAEFAPIPSLPPSPRSRSYSSKFPPLKKKDERNDVREPISRFFLFSIVDRRISLDSSRCYKRTSRDELFGVGESPNPGTGSRVSSTRVQRTRTTAEGEKTGYEGNRERSRGRGRGRESIIFELQTCYIRRGGGVTLCG